MQSFIIRVSFKRRTLYDIISSELHPGINSGQLDNPDALLNCSSYGTVKEQLVLSVTISHVCLITSGKFNLESYMLF